MCDRRKIKYFKVCSYRKKIKSKLSYNNEYDVDN